MCEKLNQSKELDTQIKQLKRSYKECREQSYRLQRINEARSCRNPFVELIRRAGQGQEGEYFKELLKDTEETEYDKEKAAILNVEIDAYRASIKKLAVNKSAIEREYFNEHIDEVLQYIQSEFSNNYDFHCEVVDSDDWHDIVFINVTLSNVCGLNLIFCWEAARASHNDISPDWIEYNVDQLYIVSDNGGPSDAAIIDKSGWDQFRLEPAESVYSPDTSDWYQMSSESRDHCAEDNLINKAREFVTMMKDHIARVTNICKQ